MLEKNAEICYFDAHFHYNFAQKYGIPDNYYGCSCAHSKEEWENQVKNTPERITLAYGIHPQSLVHEDVKSQADFLEMLIKKADGKLQAVGEAGFDFFTDEYSAKKAEQEEAWQIELELCKTYSLPLVVHCRKANNKLFEYAKDLKKIPSVLFHSFMGPEKEAESLLNKGINAYFSFGKQIMNNNKQAIECVKSLPKEVLLLETDAPFQFLKGEAYTAPKDIERIYEHAFYLRKDLCNQIEKNYKAMFWNIKSGC